MTSLLSRFRANPNHHLFLVELLAVFMWVASTLSAYFFTATPLLHSLTPSLRSLPSPRVFLSLLVVIMAIWELFGLSLGSPFNPAVTLSLAIAGDILPSHAAVMASAQFIAHLLAVLVVRKVASILHSDIDGIFHPPQPHHQVSYLTAVFIEAVITAVLCAVALSLKHIFHEKATFKKWSLMTMLIVLVLDVAGEWTGSCMNPAMSFALAALEGHWAAHSVYWIGPLVGAVLAALAHNWILAKRKRRVVQHIRRANAALAQKDSMKKTK